MFIPTTKEEISKLGWEKPDIILITGDTYIDSPHTGSAVIGKILLKAGYNVAVIAQPDVNRDSDITRLGEPALFWGVTSGCVDSMVANYTATKKKRKHDDFTPGGENSKRPDRAVIVYSNLIRKFFKNTKPIVLGGIEASMRRIPHYDYWDDTVRRSILFDAKANFLIYGMGEKAVLELAEKLKNNESTENIKGICYISQTPKDGYELLSSYEDVKTDKIKFTDMFNTFYSNNNPLTAKGLCQRQDTRYLIQNPPQYNLTAEELSGIYDIDYERDIHPYYKKNGKVRALETIRFSITTHRGCYGECNFCSLAVHQGTTVISRTKESIIEEAKKITGLPGFKGYILDVGGQTANMYGTECSKKLKHGHCKDKRCIYPEVCKSLDLSHKKQLELLAELRGLPNIKKVFVASGIRYDLVLEDKRYGSVYLKQLVLHHVSGQMKIAPEHTEDIVLREMGKPGKNYLLNFKKLFDDLNGQYGKKQFLTYYFIAAHPGCDIGEMKKLKEFAEKKLNMIPEQLQIFTPTPSTYSTLMYYTERDPFTKENIFVEKDLRKKGAQKEIILFRKKEQDTKKHSHKFNRNRFNRHSANRRFK
ncbi:MAG: YgiQ family radical SAM protein [Elusimicrobia bacterium]|nr:YgiQ family radical SAM protein [Elusimicrobiota bacterium]